MIIIPMFENPGADEQCSPKICTNCAYYANLDTFDCKRKEIKREIQDLVTGEISTFTVGGLRCRQERYEEFFTNTPCGEDGIFFKQKEKV